MQKGQKLSNKALYAWAIGNFGVSLMANSVGAVLRPILNTGFGMSAVLVSWAIFLPRFIDAFLDPILGHWSDVTHTRWGRRRPFIMVGALASAALLVVMWWMGKSWPPYLQFAYLLACSIVFGITTSLYSLPLNALGYELTDDYHERTKMNAVLTFFTVSAYMSSTWVYWLVLRPSLGGEVSGIRVVSLLLAAVIAISGLVPVFFCRERFQESNQEHLAVWKSIRTTLSNRLFRRLVLIKLFMVLGTTVFGGMLFYISTYYICAGNKELAMKIGGLGGTLYTITALAQLPFVTKLSRKLGKKVGLRIGLGILLGTTLLQPLVQNPHYPYLQIVTTVLCSPAFTLSLIFLGSFIPDICDVDELETGLRREGTFGAVAGFIEKIEYSVCTLIIGYLVDWAGFDQNLAQQPYPVIQKLCWFGYVPNFFFTLVALGLAWNFPITEELMKQVREKLEMRRSSAAARSDAPGAVSSSGSAQETPAAAEAAV